MHARIQKIFLGGPDSDRVGSASEQGSKHFTF